MNNRAMAKFFWVACWVPLIISAAFTASASEVDDYLAKLKGRYQDTLSIQAFSVTNRYLGRKDPYQSWDYQAPNRYYAFKVTDVDLKRKHYAQRVVHRFIGGQLIDEFHFQNDSESLRYETNGMVFGKGVLEQNMDSFERYKNITMTSIDFLVIRPLLQEQNIAETISLQRHATNNTTSLTHQQQNGESIKYVFSDTENNLLSLNNLTKGRIYHYQDYQTSNGLNYARTILKYYGDTSVPSFISYIEHFNILNKIEPTKLSIPDGFGPVLAKRDRKLVSSKIAPDLYLLTDSSAWRNQLLKVSGDKIMLFGAADSVELAKQSLELIAQQFPQKTIASIYITHPHSDETRTLPIYADAGIAIAADNYTLEAIKASPDFAGKASEVKFQTIEHGQKIGDMGFYVLESSISKRQGFVHFRDSGIIYQADFLEIPFDNTIARVMPGYSKTFIDFLRDNKITFQRIVGNSRNNNISPEVVDRVYQAFMM